MSKTNDELLIRRLVAEDLEAVLEIEKLSFSAPWSRESYQKEISENNLAYYLGCFLQKDGNEKLAAFAGFWLILDEGHIANVAVHPLFRGQGLGEILMRSLMALCLSAGGHWMTLEVRVSNEVARNLYNKLGFRTLGHRKGYYENGEDAVIMWGSLSGVEEKNFAPEKNN